MRSLRNVVDWGNVGWWLARGVWWVLRVGLAAAVAVLAALGLGSWVLVLF